MRKKKFPPDPPAKKTEPKGTQGSAAKLSRDKSGNLRAKLDKDFGGVTKSTQKADREARAKVGDSTFTGAPAPRGGKVKLIKSGPLKSATKKQVRQSRRKPTGSPQARASQKRNNRF